MLDQLQFGSNGQLEVSRDKTLHRKQQDGVYYSEVYTNRPPYADFPPPHENFQPVNPLSQDG